MQEQYSAGQWIRAAIKRITKLPNQLIQLSFKTRQSGGAVEVAPLGAVERGMFIVCVLLGI